MRDLADYLQRTFRSASATNNQGKLINVVLVFASEAPWRVHPDYSYSRALEPGYDLQWDAQQKDYLVTPKLRE